MQRRVFLKSIAGLSISFVVAKNIFIQEKLAEGRYVQVPSMIAQIKPNQDKWDKWNARFVEALNQHKKDIEYALLFGVRSYGA